VVEEPCYAMKYGPSQTGRDDDDANIISKIAGLGVFRSGSSL
jgi:hypothetical protein